MKKALSITLIILLLLGLTACGGPKASDKAISCGTKALEIADDYLDKSITASTAGEKLNKLKEEMKYVDDMSHDDKNKTGDFSVSVDILALSTSILTDSIKGDDKSYESVKEDRDSLAKKIGKK